MEKKKKELKDKAKKIRLLLTDCDGVLTDNGVYYSERGEEMKRFSFRDGMGVERLRKLVQIETGIITGENSDIVKQRAEKLKITEYYPGISDKLLKVKELCKKWNISLEEIAYIGDDMNDIEIMNQAGLSACPADALLPIVEIADMVTENKGGHGAFRDFAELLIHLNTK
jgi:3-deoxy-D-manno-octulosonate 8-phosphate phosphatase (KDO 8-P phosphatase)